LKALRPKPRTLRTLAAALLACVLCGSARAQTRAGDAADAKRAAPKQATPNQGAPQPDAQKKPDADTAKKANADAAHKNRDDAARKSREAREAVAALREVADSARSYEDLYESALTQSDAADALWPHDEQSARAILRRVWEAVTAPGAEDKMRASETSDDPHRAALDSLASARRSVIKVALKHDARLADAFMREFERELEDSSAAAGQDEQTPARQDGQSSDADAGQRGARSLSAAGWQRLYLAGQLLDEGDFKHAAEAAAPLAVEGPTVPLVNFIINLRAHDAREADALYLRLIEVTRADATADANDVMILSTPVVSPSLYVIARGDGSAQFIFRQASGEVAPPIPAEVRGVFFDAAASVLLRPRAPRPEGQADGEAVALYYAVGHLLPFFEREAPQYAPALNARLAALASELAPDLRNSLTQRMEINSLAPRNPVDPLAAEMNSRLRDVKTAAERDSERMIVIVHAAQRRLWDRARGLADEMEDADMRRDARLVINVRQVLDISRAYADDEGDDFERAANFVRAADVPPEVRAAGLAQAAELAARRVHGARARELLAEAASYAAQAERGNERATALTLVTLSASRADDARVWELLPALASAANETDDLRFHALVFEFVVGPPEGKFGVVAADSPVRLSDAFAAAARLDAARAFAQARALKDEEMRADALLAAARAALEKSPTPPTSSGVLRRGGK
jgi:hypothetical protein